MSSVDVIVPCYCYGKFLRECVQSVLEQRGVQVRVLIIDDASPDDSAIVGQALAQEDNRVTFRRHERNAGHIATYNEGLEWASADYLLLLSADDYLLPGALKRAADVMDANPQMSFVVGEAVDWKYMAPRPSVLECEQRNGKVSIMTGGGFFRRPDIYLNIYSPTAVVRTSIQKAAGGYREELPHCGDTEMWWRLAIRGSVGIIPAKQAVYRRHETNMSHGYQDVSDIDQRELSIQIFVEKGGVSSSDVPKMKIMLMRALAEHAVRCASNVFVTGENEIYQLSLQRALRLDPSIKFSLSWAKLMCKKFLGRPACLWIRSSRARRSGSVMSMAGQNAASGYQDR